MRRFRISLFTLGTLLLVFFFPVAALLPQEVQQPIQCRQVLTVEDVTNLLEAEVPEARVKNFVTTCKVAFKLTEEQEKKFRGLGASSDLVLAMVLNYEAPAKPEEARVCTKPLSESALTDLLEAGVVDQRLQQLVNTCGVSFQSGTEQAKRFQALGASSNLILAILRNYEAIPNYVLERTIKGHNRYVHSVAFSPDGKLLAASIYFSTLKLWDVATGRERRTLTLKGPLALVSVSSVAFSPDGRLLASDGEDKTLKLWDVRSGQEIRTLKGHTQAISSVAFSPDGKLLASGSWDNTIKLWDPDGGWELRTLKGHIGGGVSSIAFSPDGRLLASGGYDSTIKLWEVASGRELRVLKGHDTYINTVAFSPDGRLLASGSYDRTIKLWDVRTGRETRTLGPTGIVHALAFSPDGGLLAADGSSNTVNLWNPKSGGLVRTLKGHAERVSSVVFSPDGRLLASGSLRGIIKLWRREEE